MVRSGDWDLQFVERSRTGKADRRLTAVSVERWRRIAPRLHACTLGKSKLIPSITRIPIPGFKRRHFSRGAVTA
jgi:hypothetical protein